MDENDQPQNEIRTLSSAQRRVIGALMEKAFTTPDQYPLTLKALTSACNQKNNRGPVTNYSEDSVLSTVDELRDQQLIAEVFTDGGRAARYRHYMRFRFDFTETQFAIVAELLLRGAQQPGELRTRASRMVRIESLDQLRSDLAELQEKGFVRSSGALTQRGVTVDHTFYADAATPELTSVGGDESESGPQPAISGGGELEGLKQQVQQQQQQILELTDRVRQLEELLQ